MSKQPLGAARFLLALDIDGVLNAFSRNVHIDDPDDGAYRDWRVDMVEAESDVYGFARFPITWSRQMIAGLNELFADPHVQLCWLTSWGGQAHLVAGTTGLVAARPPVVVPYTKRFSDYQIGKPEGLRKFLTEQPWASAERVAVIDDEVCRGGYLYELDDVIRGFPDKQWLTIAPNSVRGISVSEMAELRQFVGADALPN